MANRTGQRNQANGRYGSPYDYSARLGDKLYETYGGYGAAPGYGPGAGYGYGPEAGYGYGPGAGYGYGPEAGYGYGPGAGYGYGAGAGYGARAGYGRRAGYGYTRTGPLIREPWAVNEWDNYYVPSVPNLLPKQRVIYMPGSSPFGLGGFGGGFGGGFPFGF